MNLAVKAVVLETGPWCNTASYGESCCIFMLGT